MYQKLIAHFLLQIYYKKLLNLIGNKGFYFIKEVVI